MTEYPLKTKVLFAGDMLEKEDIEQRPAARCLPEGRKNCFYRHIPFYKFIRYRKFLVLDYFAHGLKIFPILQQKSGANKDSSAHELCCVGDKP